MKNEPQTGMDPKKMRALLLRSKQEPVNCALGVGDDKSRALLVLATNRSSQSLQGDLQRDFPNVFNTRFGTAAVDTDDRTLVIFTLNRPVTSMARRLVKTLKGTGFRKVQLVLQDGTPVESAVDEDPAPQTESGAAEQTASGTTSPRADAAAKPDPAALIDALAALVDRFTKSDGLSAAVKETLAARAREAGANIKLGNLTYAAVGIESLRRALDATPKADATPPTDAAQSGGPKSATRAKAAPRRPLRKPASSYVSIRGREIWAAACESINQQITGLAHRLQATPDPELRELATFDLQGVDRERSQRLLNALSQIDAAPPEGQAAAREKARAVISDFRGHLRKNPLIVLLDANPLQAPLAIHATLDAALATIDENLSA